MKRIALLCSFALCACPGPSTTDAGVDSGEPEEFVFDVTGTAFMFPEGAAMLSDAGLSTSVAGLTARVEEPLRIALKDPLGEFSSAVLADAGTFSATMIRSDLVNLGVAVGIVDDAGTRAVRSATVIWDVALEGKKPDRNLTGAKAWVLPKQLHDALTAAVTEATIMGFTTGSPKRTLVSAGCIVGRVVTSAGAPVSGATLVSTTASLTQRFAYPNADLTGTGAATSSNGLFVYVHDGSDNVAQFRFDVMGATGYNRRSAGAAKDACLVMTVYPGTTPPP